MSDVGFSFREYMVKRFVGGVTPLRVIPVDNEQQNEELRMRHAGRAVHVEGDTERSFTAAQKPIL